MKKHAFIVIMMMASVMAFVSCNKNNDPAESYSLKYQISNEVRFTDPATQTVTVLTLSPCFHFDISYVDANGNLVEEHNITAPWEKTLAISKPFHAKLEGTATFNVDELPEWVTFGTPYSISITGNGVIKYDENNNLSTFTKENFVEHIAGSDLMSFSGSVDFE